MRFSKYILATLFFLACWSTAYSHEWYSKKRDPVTKGGCCGGSDCAKLVATPDVLQATDAGYRITLTLEQAKKINPYRRDPVDIVIPWDRIQLSEDGNYHLCLPIWSNTVRDGFFCFFAPGSI